jgi:hypothetical protein
MSLGKLPVELDLMVAGFVEDQRDLSALSKCSKYYRSVVTPLLYESIDINPEHQITTLQLMSTLIQQPELALYIKTLKLSLHTVDNSHPNYYPAHHLRKLSSLSSLVNDRINQIMHHESENDASLELARRLKTCLNECHISGRRDGWTVAAILCMAKNLETFETCLTYAVLKGVLQFPWKNTGEQPLSKIKNWTFCSCIGSGPSPILVLPVMEKLKITEMRALHMFTPEWRHPVPMPQVPLLHTLEFICARVDAYRVSQLIKSPSLANLKVLRVQKCVEIEVPGPNAGEDDWNMPKLVQVLKEYVPKLERFSWTYQSFKPPKIVPFNDFQDLTNLKFLAVDYELLRRTLKENLFSQPATCFPDTLRELRTTGSPLKRMYRIVDAYGNPIDAPEDKVKTFAWAYWYADPKVVA